MASSHKGRGGATAFHFVAPSVQGSQGHISTAKLVLDSTPATIRLDPSFLASAVYPVTIQRTTLLGSAAATVAAAEPLPSAGSAEPQASTLDDSAVGQTLGLDDATEQQQPQSEAASHSVAQALPSATDPWVWGWGDDGFGELGSTGTSSCVDSSNTSNSNPCSPTPQQVQGLSGPMGMLGAGGWFSTAAAASASRTASTTYTYDNLYRLTGAAGPAGTTSYSYDPTGNRLSKVLGGQTTSYSYDKADRILNAGTTSYTVNAAGNLTARGSDSFGYDQVNRLKSTTVGTNTGTYVYDGDGKRVSKTVGGVTTSYVYDVAGGLPVLLDDGARKYVWGAGGLAFTVDKTSAALQVYQTDGLGSVRAITDSTGSIVQTYQSDEFGIPVAADTQGSSSQPFGYTGEQRDPENGLVYLRARMYDAVSGRFVQRDQVPGRQSDPLTLNRYTYGLDNPARITDHSGLTGHDSIDEQTRDSLPQASSGATCEIGPTYAAAR